MRGALVAVLVAAAPAAIGCGGATSPRNVLVVTLDTLRADRVGSYGYAGAQTPVLDAPGGARRPLRRRRPRPRR